MNRRTFLKLVGSIPVLGWLVPKVEATPVEYARFVGGKGEIPPKFKWVMDGVLTEWPGEKYYRENGYKPENKNLYPDSIYIKVESVSDEWHMQSCLKIQPGHNYSFPDTIFTRDNRCPPLSQEERDSFGLQPQPVPPHGTRVSIMLCRYITSSGYYSYGYCAKVRA